MSESVLKGLEPAAVWKYFEEISKIPRGSKNEARIAEYMEKKAAEFGLQVRRDDLGNVVVQKPASPGKEDKATVVLQGHLDMVCEKNRDKEHDFTKDPITLLREGDWITADGTTLGADNGIALAAGLALMEDKEAVHGPLEFFFTVDEETGMTGVKEMKPDLLKGRILLNLDSEEDGIIYIGCAGGQDTIFHLSAKLEDAPRDAVPLLVAVRGLKGGHSGCDIDAGRACAIRVLTRALWLLDEKSGIRLARLEGGNKRNAIAREAEALIYVDPAEKEKVAGLLSRLDEELKIEFKLQDPQVSILLEDKVDDAAGKVFEKNDKDRVLRLLSALPHGVLQYSAAVKGLVETSINLGVVTCNEGKVDVNLLARSSLDSAKEELGARLRAIGAMAGAEVEQQKGYPGWNPNLDSKILNVCKQVYKKLYDKDPEVKAIHAGLECAIIGGKIPGMDMISFGPTITGPHSPDEKLQISTVPKFFEFTKAVLEELAS